ncbi:MAG TPA: TetR/AcrR family transcriptional regulator [Steroidobacteraceae bacterium]|nr:TetR/AcrR family transcriptional regulator [Steroidobacteraceae bacterium]
MPLKKNSGKPLLTQRKADPARIVAAAIACIEKYGAKHTGVAEIAAAAQVGRQTVYRVFPTRKLLLEAVLTERLRLMAQKLRPVIAGYDSFEDAVVNGSIKSVATSRGDEIFVAALNEIDHAGAERYLVSPGSPMDDFMSLVWSEALTSARARGELRANLKDLDILNWLRAVLLIVTIREDLKPREVAALLKAFVVPSLVTGIPAP